MKGNELRAGDRIQRLAWALAATCFLALLLGYATSAWLAMRTEKDRAGEEELASKIGKSDLAVRTRWTQLSGHIDHVLESASGNPVPEAGAADVQALREALAHYDATIRSLNLGDQEAVENLARSAEGLEALTTRIFAWRRASSENDQRLESALRSVEQTLKDASVAIAAAQGRTKLAAIKTLRAAESNIESERGTRIEALKAALLVQSSLSMFGADLAEVQSATSRLGRLKDLGMLASLEQNDLRPSLNRMAGVIRQANGQDLDWTAIEGRLVDLTSGLMGAQPGSKEQPKVPGALDLRRESLNITALGAVVRREWTALKEDWNTELPALQSVRDRALSIAGELLEARLRGSHKWMRGSAIASALIVLFLCWRIGRSIRAHVAQLEGVTSSLAGANATMHTHVAALESAPDGILIVTPQGEPTWTNSAYRGLIESRPADAGSVLLPGCEHGSEPTQEILAQVRASGERWSGRRSGKRGDGSQYSAAQSVTPVRDHAGRMVSIVCILRDVTEDLRREEELRELHEDNELILQSLSAMLISTDTERKVSAWNAVATSILGTECGPPQGIDIADLKLPWTVEPILTALDAAMQRRESSRLDAIPVRTNAGPLRYLALGVTPMVDRNDRLRGCLILGRDVTQQRALELQLQQSQKLESIGQLAAGIAHEINTPTQFINDNTRFVRESFAELAPLLECCRALAENSTDEATITTLREALGKTDLTYLAEEVPRALDESLGGIARVASIVKAMKQFSHPGNTELECVNLNQALESTVTVARNEWKYVAEMELDLAPELPLVPCYPGELNQAVLNMIVNAAHAIGDVVKQSPGALGKIRIQTRCDEEWARIRISDTGSGIPEAIRQRIFDPFFTTKGVGKGTGQGLAIARSVVVDKHKGRIDVESEVGKGTTFLIEIPLKGRDETDAEASASEKVPA